MKATDLLKQQHKEVLGLFKALEAAGSDEKKQEIFEELAANLVAHDAIEREIFYPACEQKMGLNDQLGEALVEHGVVEFSLYQSTEAKGKPDFEYKCKVLQEILEHHIEEEEKEFFPKVEKALGEDLETLGEDMEERFDECLEEDFRTPLYENLRQVMAGTIKPNPEAATKAARKTA